MEIKLIKSNFGVSENDTITLAGVSDAGNSGSLVVVSPIKLMTETGYNGYGHELVEHLKEHPELFNAVRKKLSYSTVLNLGYIAYDILYVPDYVVVSLNKEYTLTKPIEEVISDNFLVPFTPNGTADCPEDESAIINPTDLDAVEIPDMNEEQIKAFHDKLAREGCRGRLIQPVPVYTKPDEVELDLHRFIRNLTVCIHNSLKDGDMSFHEGYSLLVANYLYRVQNVSTYDSTLDFEVYNDNYTVKVDIGDLTAVKVTVVNNLDRSNTTVLTTSEKLLNWIPLSI